MVTVVVDLVVMVVGVWWCGGGKISGVVLQVRGYIVNINVSCKVVVYM